MCFWWQLWRYIRRLDWFYFILLKLLIFNLILWSSSHHQPLLIWSLLLFLFILFPLSALFKEMDSEPSEDNSESKITILVNSLMLFLVAFLMHCFLHFSNRVFVSVVSKSLETSDEQFGSNTIVLDTFFFVFVWRWVFKNTI